MSRWKALPEGLGPELTQFVVQLRRAKDRSGLSLAGLAAKTGYSASSWERYLGGRALPPRAAVEALSRVVNTDPARLLVLYELAAEALDPEETEESETSAPDQREAPAAVTTRLSLRTAVISAAVGAALTAVLLSTRPWENSSGSGQASASPTGYTCHFTRTGGLWFTGNSTTRSDLVQLGMTGPEVAEVQCLLQRAGVSPGGVDGIFGPLTERAVRLEQQQGHTGVDGIVGPETWGVLRG